MKIKIILGAVLVVTLSGCGGSHEDLAVDICAKASDERTASQMGSVDRGEMRTAAKSQPDGTISIDGKVYYRRGAEDQRSQSFSCLVRFDASETPSVQKFVIQPFFD